MAVDLDQFMNVEVEGKTSTDFIPVPAGEYNAKIVEMKLRSGTSDKGEWNCLDLFWEIDDTTGKVIEVTKRETNRVKQGVFLNLTAEGGLANGENQSLGFVREAVGQNKDGKPWSPKKLMGGTAKVTVEHRKYQVDGQDQLGAEVKKVTKL